MIAKLINNKDQVVREWHTDQPDLAMTADRNRPIGWRVELVAYGRSSPDDDNANIQIVGLPI